MTTTLIENISEMREQEALEEVKNLLEQGRDPLKILAECKEAMDIVGQRFSEGKYFIPELMMAGEILSQISNITKSKISSAAKKEEACLGKVALGTVQGDIHDLGKNIVSFMLDLNGFKVVDIGVDAPPEKFVEAVRNNKPDIVGLCGLLTLAYDPMKDTVSALKDAGLRDDIKIMVGGGAVDDEIRKYSGADAYGKDAIEAVTLAKQWMEVN